MHAQILDAYFIQHIEELAANVTSDRDWLPNLTEATIACSYVRRASNGRETMAPFAWNIRDLHCYSVSLAVPEDAQLVRNLLWVVLDFSRHKIQKDAKW